MSSLVDQLAQVESAGLIRNGEKMALVPWNLVNDCKQELQHLYRESKIREQLLNSQASQIHTLTSQSEEQEKRISAAICVLQTGKSS